MKDNLKEIYNEFAREYDENRDIFDISEIIESFWNKLSKPKGKLLDLGCGAGVPFAQSFVEKGWEVIGVDFSEEMLRAANKNVPEMKTILSDITKIEIPGNSIDAVSAIYSLFHLPKEEQSLLFKRVRKWLKPGGKFLFTYASREYTGKDEFDGSITFMEQELYYSHTTPEKLRSELTKTGFSNLKFEYHEIGGEIFLWVTAGKE